MSKKVTETVNDVKTSIIHRMNFSDKEKLYIKRFVTVAETDVFTRKQLREAAQSKKMGDLAHEYCPAFLVKNHALLVSVASETQRGIYRVPAIALKLIDDAKLRETIKANRDTFMKSIVSRAKARAIANAETVSASSASSSASSSANAVSDVTNAVSDVTNAVSDVTA